MTPLVDILVTVASALVIAGVVAMARWAASISKRVTTLTWVTWSSIHRQDPAYAATVSAVLFTDSPDLQGGNSA